MCPPVGVHGALPPAGHLNQVYSLDFATQNRSPLRGGKPNIRPPTRGVELGQWRPSAFCSPRRPARRLGRLHGCGACRPQTPWGCAPCAPPGARHPCMGQSKARVGASAVGNRRLSTVRSNPRRRLGQAKRVRPVGRTPVGKGGGRCGVVGSGAVHKSMPTPLLSIGQKRHAPDAPRYPSRAPALDACYA